MPNYKITDHAMTRMSQRAVRDEDVEMVLTWGTQIGPAEWLIRRKDANREITARKRIVQRLKHRFPRAGAIDRQIAVLEGEIRQIDRLSGKQLKIVMVDCVILTCYPSSRADQRRTFRRGREAGCFEKRNHI